MLDTSYRIKVDTHYDMPRVKMWMDYPAPAGHYPDGRQTVSVLLGTAIKWPGEDKWLEAYNYTPTADEPEPVADLLNALDF